MGSLILLPPLLRRYNWGLETLTLSNIMAPSIPASCQASPWRSSGYWLSFPISASEHWWRYIAPCQGPVPHPTHPNRSGTAFCCPMLSPMSPHIPLAKPERWRNWIVVLTDGALPHTLPSIPALQTTSFPAAPLTLSSSPLRAPSEVMFMLWVDILRSVAENGYTGD